ncbi:YcjF family protein [Aureimonas mangrovi]|uniref:YcjF family protein n=1 Tax=Aureimonas mangrovi TaxID=2758041 RepID=UPI00163DD7D1|nr:TIGR01620 family protein [Aureimonas mangrovi]
MSDEPRAPRAFPSAQPAAAAPPLSRAPRAIGELERVAIEPDDALEREALEELDAAPARRRPKRRGWTFGGIFMAAAGALVSLGIGLAIDSLIRDLFQRAEWLGWVALAATVLLVISVLGLVGREMLALFRLRAVEAERRASAEAFETNSDEKAAAAIAGLRSILAGKPELDARLKAFDALKDDVMDGRDRMVVAERDLLLPLDAKGRALVLASAKRVSLVTALSPRAAVDLIFVLFETVRLIRRISELYGARPGTVGLIRLTRDVLAHLAVTGSIAIGDGLVQQVIGHGLASRLSAKLGEGVVNGLLTARVGIAAMDLCRPMPFLAVKRPTAGDFVSDLTRLAASQGDGGKAARAPSQESVNPHER